MKKKILAVFLSLCMAMSLLPVTALAAGDGETETQTPTETSITTEGALKKAIEDTQSGGIVTLGADIAITAPVVINKQITLNLNGKTISASSPIWNKDEGRWSLISVGEGGDLTVTGNGTLQARENDTYAIDVNGGSCAIENGTFVGNVHAVYVLQGTLVVNGGTFSVQQKYSETQPYQFVLNCYDTNYKDGLAQITVYGGSFKGFNPRDCEAEGVGTNFCAPGYVVDVKKGQQGTDLDTYTVRKLDEGSMAVFPAQSTEGIVSASLEGTFTSSTDKIQDSGTEGEPSGAVNEGNVSVNLTMKDGNSSTAASLKVATDTAKSLANNANSLTVESDVGTVTLDKTALGELKDVSEPVVISIEATNEDDAAPTWEVTVKEGKEELFAETTDVGITITVPAPAGASDNTKVYCIDNGMEDMRAVYDKAENTLAWTTEHLSTFAAITLNGEEASWVANGTPQTTGKGTLEEALQAVDTDGGTITLYKDAADLENANYTIQKPVTIVGNGHKVTATVADTSAITIAFTVTGENVAFTLNNVDLTINGSMEGGTGFDVKNTGASLVLDNATVTLNDLKRGLVMSGTATDVGKLAKINIKNGSNFTIQDVGGNASNGGIWTVDNSSLTVKGCTDYGLSVNSLTTSGNTSINISGTGYGAIYGHAALTFGDGTTVNVSECGNKLPYTSTGNYGDCVAPIQMRVKHAAGDPDSEVADSTEATLTIENGAVVTIENCKTISGKNNNIIYLPANVTYNNNGTVNAEVVASSESEKKVVTVVDRGNTLSVSFVENGENYNLPSAPNDYGYNHFVGWSDGITTYQPGAVVTISKDTTFTAVWSYIPPANPNYKITIGDMENGTVTANPTAAKAGATVTLTPVPDEGYALSTLTVTDRFGDAVKVTENADGTYTFTMPNGQVTVSATFVETQEPAPAEPFPDVDENDWFYDEVVYVYENGLMNGVENNQFAPNTATNRAMLATILYRLAGEPAVSGDLPFTDVESGTWYTDAVLWAAQNGIVNGLGENTFAPMNTLTREQLVTMLYRYAEAEGYDVSAAADLSGYPDAGKVQPYAQEAMSWAVAEGIVEGMDGNLNPAGSATRAQIATILMRFCEGVAK